MNTLKNVSKSDHKFFSNNKLDKTKTNAILFYFLLDFALKIKTSWRN